MKLLCRAFDTLSHWPQIDYLVRFVPLKSSIPVFSQSDTLLVCLSPFRPTTLNGDGFESADWKLSNVLRQTDWCRGNVFLMPLRRLKLSFSTLSGERSRRPCKTPEQPSTRGPLYSENTRSCLERVPFQTLEPMAKAQMLLNRGRIFMEIRPLAFDNEAQAQQRETCRMKARVRLRPKSARHAIALESRLLVPKESEPP